MPEPANQINRPPPGSSDKPFDGSRGSSAAPPPSEPRCPQDEAARGGGERTFRPKSARP